MCGIVGHIKQRGNIDQALFEQMRDTLMHRGPDDADSKFFENDTVALGHRRLSFIDLSEAGRQPMSNEDETIWIVLNGEIYNYIEIRSELIQKGHIFKTHSDTEVIIHGYEEWGTNILNKLKGMFAFGLLDLRNKRLILVRDRFGIKPLYYTFFDGQFIFASELKAIMKCSDVNRKMDVSSFTDYFVYRYIPSPKTIWENIYKLPPAYYLIFDYTSSAIEQVEYWKLPYSSHPDSDQTLIDEVGHLLENSVSIHARSDVPIGSFLSGGYDSSAVVYYLSKLGYKPDAFTIGFKNWNNSEDRYAKIVADHFNVPLTSLMVGDSDLDRLEMMPEVYDEPIADISILPTWLVSNSAAKKVKAVMSGEGADELFGGYSWQKKFLADKQLMSPIKKLFLTLNKIKSDNAVAYYADAMAMGRFDSSELQKMLHKDYYKYIAEDTDWFYRKNMDSSLSPLKSIQQMDIKCFMGELVLTKIDRASMANSLEVRVPFLDHELFEKVFSMSEEAYYKSDTTKYLLFENIKNALPKEVLVRPKQGFVGPDSFYMNLQRYKTILDHAVLFRDGIIRKEYYIQLLAHSDHWRLWKLAIMELWYKHWIAKA